ncbi:MAG: 2Fe-2S ferredoxin, partial [Gammaproteobacteria bacterium]
QNFLQNIQPKARCGLRVNPQLSLIKDARYDPCRRYSKLGVPLLQLEMVLNEMPQQLDGITGLLVHNNCDATDLKGLINTVQHLEKHLQPLLEKLDWINLGGGYLFNEADDENSLQDLIRSIEERYQLQTLFEPGSAISRKAGYFIATVLDMFISEGRHIVVLDTTINHMPEVFEYQFEPDIIGDTESGTYKYLLAGSTCLAGDIFGEYAFNKELKIGSRIIFENAGAYTMVKASMFNGINLPNIYMLTQDANLKMVKQFNYRDYLNQCGAE